MAEFKPNGIPGTVVGKFRLAVTTGLTTGLVVGDTIFSGRWGSASLRVAIAQLRVTAQIVTPFTAAQELIVSAYVARTFTIADTGGNALTLSAPLQQIDSVTSAASAFTDMRVATAAPVTAGTRVLDTLPLLHVIGAQELAAASAAFSPIVGNYEPGITRYPQILTQNEGIVVRNIVAHGAGGTVRHLIELEWLEFIPNPC